MSTIVSAGLSRRGFMKVTAGGLLGYYVLNRLGVPQLAHAAPIPGGTLVPAAVPKFVAPLVIPPAMPNNGKLHQYTIAVQQFSQQILPAGLPPTTVWSYGLPGKVALNYPAFTIEATRGNPTQVTWINGLVNEDGKSIPHLLPVDPTLHWANPPGGMDGRDTRPSFDATPGPYTGPVPIVTHVHGMENVADHSDGYAEAWYLPDSTDIPDGFAKVGTWYDFFATKAGGGWDPGSATFGYPNSQRPSTLWYHDHTLGMTRLNVYAGPAGFYIIRSADPDDNPTAAGGGPAVLPGPAPQLGDSPGRHYYEIPIAIQDRSFNVDGSLFYPDTRAFFDGFAGPYIPDTDVSPIWNPEFFGNTMVVNGSTWPYLDVEPRRYRLRLLNGCQSRFLQLQFKSLTTTARPAVWQIGNEGGFLRAPVRLKELLMAPAERADVIVDFTSIPLGTTITMVNGGPDAPFGGGGFRPADPASTGLVMQFRVNVPLKGADASTPPAQLTMPAAPPVGPSKTTRTLALLEQMSMSPGVPPIPVEALLGVFDTGQGLPNGVTAIKWHEPVTENPGPGDCEAWEIYNFTADAHPIHIHQVFFEVVNRQRLDAKTGLPVKKAFPPEAWEDGYKDTVIAYPGQVTRVRMTFGQPGQYVWHCHIVEHEDNEMMRPYRVGPKQPGQPMGSMHGGMH
jgi:FtsP/CotA-like multicopper oxidase with cupredoxin domain